jgi:hypothetical protein
MSMSTTVMGFRPPDGDWDKKKKAYEACIEAGVEVPDELYDYFEGQSPSDHGQSVDLGNCLVEWKSPEGASEGYELDLGLLPKGVKVLRFFNSW